MKQSDLVQGREYMVGDSKSGQFCHFVKVGYHGYDKPQEPAKAVFVGTIKTHGGEHNIFYSTRLGAYWMYSTRILDYVEEVPKYFLLLGEFVWCEDSETWIIQSIEKAETFESYEDAEIRGGHLLETSEFGTYIITSKGERISFL